MTPGEQRILDVLERLVRVQAIQVASGKSITDGARLLKLAGLDNQTIADVLNTSAGTIRTVTANLRSGARVRRRKGR